MAIATPPRYVTGKHRTVTEVPRPARRLLVASNRGPFQYDLQVDGSVTAQRGSGGLVSAFTGLSRHAGLDWVACAMTQGDRAVARGLAAPAPSAATAGGEVAVRFVAAPPATYARHYNVFANPILWFVQHNLHHLLPQSGLAELAADAWYNGYLLINRSLAGAVLAELRRPGVAPVVLLQDYQLYMVAATIRRRAPEILLQHFIHIPWPKPSAWEALPRPITRALCDSLLANDVVGFQTERDVANFLATCAHYLPAVRVDALGRVVHQFGRSTRVRAYPISVDVPALRELASSSLVAAHEARLRPAAGEQTIVRVDRLDPSKNVLTGFQAFRALLRRRPDLVGRVRFLAFLVPTRTGVSEYQCYAREVFAAVEAINAEFGCEGWQPIQVFYENNYAQAIAGMRLYDVLMINSGADGMNLVSKEGPIVNARDGVLVLSRGAGSYEQLRGGALGIEPFDVAGTARALEQALALPADERRVRAAALRRVVEQHDLSDWLRDQLEDLAALAPTTLASRELRSYALSA